jgi:hypothetical protein
MTKSLVTVIFFFEQGYSILILLLGTGFKSLDLDISGIHQMKSYSYKAFQMS